MYKFTFQLDEKERLEYQIHTFWTQNSGKIALALMTIGFMVFLSIKYVAHLTITASLYITLLVILGGFVLIMESFVYYLREQEGTNPLLTDWQTIIINNKGFYHKTKHSQDYRDWTCIDKVYTGKNHLFIYADSSLKIYVIPYRVFNEISVEHLLSFVLDKLNKTLEKIKKEQSKTNK